MKGELMRPEVDATSYVRYNSWDRGREGLLAGEALHLDLKRMELAYHDNNRREHELTRFVSLRQLDPQALLSLKLTGRCDVTIPEWFYDRDCPGHYMRRIKSVAVSLPAVVGRYTSVNCTLTLLRSQVRVSSQLSPSGPYGRDPDSDGRFVDYLGSAESVVTSSATDDSGMFDVDLRDERFLPFEGAGAVGTWRLEPASEFRPFDYDSIPDVVLRVRYTARSGGALLRAKAAEAVGRNEGARPVGAGSLVLAALRIPRGVGGVQSRRPREADPAARSVPLHGAERGAAGRCVDAVRALRRAVASTVDYRRARRHERRAQRSLGLRSPDPRCRRRAETRRHSGLSARSVLHRHLTERPPPARSNDMR
jgi:hypothetical protein